MNFLSQALTTQPEPDWSRVQALPIHECDEPLVPLGLVPPPIRVYPTYFHLGIGGALSECYVRRSVLARLQKAARLLPAGIELVVLDGWRPLAVQQYLFNTLTQALRRHFPGEDEAGLLARARHFVAPASAEAASPSPHLTGGAVDVTLCDTEGGMLDMGTEFDDIGPWSATAAFEAVARPGPKEAEIIENRRLLYSVMIRAGFSNLPSEWWHFDYGNQNWAWFTQQPHALYGPARLPGLAGRWERQVALLGG
jgi:D-alanyl-D-alanine dipeptidase